MPTIEVVSGFRFSPDGRETITYEPGTHHGVTELCEQYARAKGFLAGGMPLADIAGSDIFPTAGGVPLASAARKKSRQGQTQEQKRSSALVICGDAPCLHDDLAMLGATDADYLAVNRAGFKMLQPIVWWATYHPDALYHENWPKQRAQNGGNSDFTVVAHQRNIALERAGIACRVFAGPSRTGSSSLLAVLFGLSQGYERVVVVGAPLNAEGYRDFQDGWRAKAPHLAGRVRSLSGWTKTFLEGLNHGA